MPQAVRHLLKGSIDYAGLFPPAALSLASAVSHYHRYWSGPDRWILNRFVCPVDRLTELLPLLEGVDARGWPVTVLGHSLAAFEDDLHAIERFEAAAKDRAEVQCFEVRAQPGELRPEVLRPISDAGFEEVYIELPPTEEALASLDVLVETDVIGPKLRTGGLQPDAFPTVEQLAAFLREAICLDLPYKLTAGLHEPFYHWDESIGAWMHGFVNVFVAGCLTYCHDLARSEIETILRQEVKSAFWFSDLGMGFGELEATLHDVEVFRSLFKSFGSCSVDEPLDSLHELGWVRREVTA